MTLCHLTVLRVFYGRSSNLSLRSHWWRLSVRSIAQGHWNEDLHQAGLEPLTSPFAILDPPIALLMMSQWGGLNVKIKKCHKLNLTRRRCLCKALSAGGGARAGTMQEAEPEPPTRNHRDRF